MRSLRTTFLLALLCLFGFLPNAHAQAPAVNFTWEFQGGPPGGPEPANFDTINHPVAFGTSRFGSVALGDVDGDGDKDFISGSRIGELYFYENQGNATNPSFVRVPQLTIDTIDIGPSQNLNECRPTLVDIDGDLDLDLFVLSRYDYNGFNFADDIHYFENIGTPTAPEWSLVPANLPGLKFQNTGEFGSAAFADMDNDTDLDMICGGSDSIAYFENIGTPTAPSFQRLTNANNPLDGWTDNSFLAPTPDLEDLDGDGDYDLYYGSESGFIRMLENVGTPSAQAWGTFTTVPAHTHLDTIDFGSFVAMNIEDITGDGFKDIVICTFQPSTYYWYKAIVPCSVDTNTIAVNECTSYTVPSGDETYTSSGTYSDTLTNNCGLDSILTINLTIGDVSPPTMICSNTTVYLDGSGNASITAADVDGGSTDACNGITLSISSSTFDCSQAGTTVPVVLTGVDGLGFTDSCTAMVTVIDSTAPTAVCRNFTLNLAAGGNAVLVADSLNNGSTDNCSGSLSFSASQVNFNCSDVGPNNVTLTVTDGAGNSSSCSAVVTVHDVTNPAAICQNITRVLDGTGNVSITAADVNNGSADDCILSGMTISQTNFTCADVGANNVTLIVTDIDGNQDSCVAVVTIEDNQAPVLAACPSDLNLFAGSNCDAIATWTNPTATDNCSGVVVTSSIASGSNFAVGTTNVLVTATDAGGNTDTCSFNVTVTDSTAPVANCRNFTLNLAVGGNAVLVADSLDNGSADNCTGPLTFSASQVNFNCSDIGSNNVTLTVTDASGNSSTCTAVVTVHDVTNPVAICQNITRALDGSGNVTITAADINNGSADDCALSSTTASQTSFSCADIGANNVTLVVTDLDGNQDSCVAVVTIEDNQAPVLAACPADINVTANNANCEAIVSWTNPTATDNCSGVTVTSSIASGSSFPLGTTNVLVTATDAGGNTDTCSFNVTVTNDMTVTFDNAVAVSCNGLSDGGINITVNNGSSPFVFDWDNDGIGDNDDAEDLTGVIAGAYNVAVTDANGCPATGGAFTVTEPTALVATIDLSTNPSACGQADGSIMISVTGGTTAYNYDWDNDGTGDNNDAEDLMNIPAGTYTGIVIDANGCTDTVMATLNDPSAPVVTIDSVTHVACNGDSSGVIHVTTTGGSGAITYDWDNDGTGDNDDAEDLTNVAAGMYAVIATDVNGCVGNGTATVTEPSAIMVSSSTSDVLCNGDANGTATLASSGGTGALTEDWGGNDPNLLPAGTFTYMVTDDNGCVYTDSVVINEPAAVAATTVITDVSCFGGMDGTATVSATGGVGALTEDWGSEDPTMLSAGTFTYMVMDTNGCTYTDSVTIAEPVAPLALSATATDEMMGNDGTIDLTVTGGTAGYTYDWDNDGLGDNDDTEDLSGLVGNMTYTVYVTDANGCMDSLTVDVGSQVSIETLSNQLGLKLFPNPSHGQFTVTMAQGSEGSISIVGIDGKVVAQEALNGRTNIRFNLASIESGIYIVKVMTPTANSAHTLVIEK